MYKGFWQKGMRHGKGTFRRREHEPEEE